MLGPIVPWSGMDETLVLSFNMARGAGAGGGMRGAKKKMRGLHHARQERGRWCDMSEAAEKCC